jgi:AraC-like DNA-binding protein
MGRARQLLLAGNSPKKVSLELGYKQLSHFYRNFKHAVGITPKQFVATRRLRRHRMPPPNSGCSLLIQVIQCPK